MISVPTATTCPTLALSAITVPATEDGISTVALSVITSARIWSSATTSPTFTCQATSSTSAMPSPISGILIVWVAMSGLHHTFECGRHPRWPGKIGPLLGVWVGRVPAGHALNRGFQVIEAMLLDQRRKFSAQPVGARGFMHDDAAAGLLDRSHQRVEVERPQAAQVNHFGIHAAFKCRGRADMHHGAVGDHRPVSYTHLRAHETDSYLVCRLLLEK